MGDSQKNSTRSALRRAGLGEIVEVQGGHIVRATGLKDRHSKVCTAKGPRDRRVRLSAHTAIEFYDVQDRLGYDRPSKAVDWLIKKAKAAIDELDKLPAWSPTNMNLSSSSKRRGRSSGGGRLADLGGDEVLAGAVEMFGGTHKHHQHQDEEQQQQNIYNNANSLTSSLLPPSLGSDAIADTIKSFFPIGSAAHEDGTTTTTTTTSASSPPQMQFQEYSQEGLLPRSGISSSIIRQSQDLRLSLQSFQDPILMHSHHQAAHDGQHSHHQAAHDGQHSLFPGAASVGFDNPNGGWAQSSPDYGWLQRLMVGWNNDTGTEHHSVSGIGSSSGSSGGEGGFMFNPPPVLQPLFGGLHSQLFTQRGPLQSSNTPSIRAWVGDPSVFSTNEHHQMISIHPQALSGIGFSSGGFSGFHVPARIQGEKEHDGYPNKPSSASSGSRH